MDHDFNVQLPKAADLIFSTHQSFKSKKSLAIRDVFISCERCNETITVPVPNHKEIRSGTLMSIIRQSKLNRSIFEAN